MTVCTPGPYIRTSMHIDESQISPPVASMIYWMAGHHLRAYIRSPKSLALHAADAPAVMVIEGASHVIIV